MLDAGRQRRVLPGDRTPVGRQAPQQVRKLDDLRTLHVELHVPAEIRDAFRERLDHATLTTAVAGVTQGEADAAARLPQRALSTRHP